MVHVWRTQNYTILHFLRGKFVLQFPVDCLIFLGHMSGEGFLILVIGQDEAFPGRSGKLNTCSSFNFLSVDTENAENDL